MRILFIRRISANPLVGAEFFKMLLLCRGEAVFGVLESSLSYGHDLAYATKLVVTGLTSAFFQTHTSSAVTDFLHPASGR